MNLFIKQLSIGIILMLIQNHCNCYDSSEMKQLASQIKQYADNGKIIESESNGLYLKPEKGGKLGFGAFGLVWKCNLILKFYHL